jgi:hypothetical protein
MTAPDSETTRIARRYVSALERSISADAHAKSVEPPAVTAARVRISSAPPMAAPLPGLAGYRVMSPGYADISLVDPEGYRRRIADQTTYNLLFRDWSGIVDANIDQIAQGPPIGPGAVLVRGHWSETIYLLDGGKRRLITSAAIMDKYWFKWDRVCVMTHSVVEKIPMGEDWE